MTNGEKIQKVLNCEVCEPIIEKEPITKNNSEVEEHKGEVMDFPNTFDEFADYYGFKDTEEVYTNGSELIQVYRVKQWLEHINETTTMIDKSNFSQEQYKADLQSAYDCGYSQACKSKITMPYATLDNCGNYIEQTPMSDLAVDCISRKEVFETIDDCNRDGLKGIFCSYNDGERFKEYIKNLPPVTPQEPVIDKIRAEIEEHAKINQNLNTDRARALCWCLDVIDKYKADRSKNDNT